MRCWNCLSENLEKARRCESCDQPLKPNPAQAMASKRNVTYLLHEIGKWSFLEPPHRDRVEAVYNARLSRLEDLGGSKAWVEWPVSDWVEQTGEPETAQESADVVAQAADVVAASQKNSVISETLEREEKPEKAEEQPEPPETDEKASETETIPDSVKKKPDTATPPPALKPAEPSLVATLVGEADIRWFHSLGALLVVAAVVGWLRASWDSYGKLLAGLLIASSPLILHFVAHKLKKSVPLSARLLAILANILTPPALLALDVFGALPDFVPGKLYWTFSLLVSAAILSWQAEKTQEKVPLFVGALCGVMAGWSQGALTTAMCSLAVGFLFAWDTESDSPEWGKLRKSVSFYAGSFGAITTLALFDTSNNPFLPMTAFTAALVFLHLPTLTGHSDSNSQSRVFMQTALTLVGCVLMRAVLGVPAGGVALYLIFASALFLTAKPDSQVAAGAAKIARALGAISLAIGFLSDLTTVLSSQQSLHQAGLRFLFTAVGTGFFWMSSRKNRHDQTLFLLGLLTLLGGWAHLLLFAITRQPLDGVDQFAPLLGSLPVFASLLLIASRFMETAEKRTTESFLFPLMAGSLALGALARLINPAAALSWNIVLLLHVALTLTMERGWLASKPETKSALLGLPRLTIIGSTALLLALIDLPVQTCLLAATAVLIAAGFFLKEAYGDACFEVSWVALWMGIPLAKEAMWLYTGALLSFTLSLHSAERKPLGLVTSAAYSLAVMTVVTQDLPYLLLFLPALCFAVFLRLPARRGSAVELPPKHRYGFDLLLAGAILIGQRPDGGSLESLAYCLVLTALAFGFTLACKKAPEKAARLLSPYSGPALFGVLLFWSFGQSTLETGLLLILASAAAYFAAPVNHRGEICNALAITGTAQVVTQTHLILDPVVVGVGILLSESISLFRRGASAHLSNLALLVVASLQDQPSIVEGWTAETLLFASLMLALRCVQQDLYSSAIASGALFLWKVDPYIADDLDFKYRALPMAAVFIACAIWKWRRDFSWTKPVLHTGLALLVAPAGLQFIAGYQLALNFAWMLAFGCAFLGLSFVLPEAFRHSFRQAGGYTLTAWAGISLSRVALELPWQAATLMIGVGLVTIGVIVERRNRRKSS